MTDRTTKLSTTGRAMLTLAASRADQLVLPPKLPVAAARQVVHSLINNGLLEEIAAAADDPPSTWRTGGDGVAMVLRAIAAGVDIVSEGAGTGDRPAPNDWSNRIEPASPALIALVEHIEMDKTVGEQATGCAGSDNVLVAEHATRRLGLRQAAEVVLTAREGNGRSKSHARAAPGAPGRATHRAQAGHDASPDWPAARRDQADARAGNAPPRGGRYGSADRRGNGLASHTVRAFMAD